MAQPWFKFYGGKYLSDSKIARLSSSERSCWITLLCLASQTEDNVIKFLSENSLMHLSGVAFALDEWEETIGVLEKFISLDMITMPNLDTIIINNYTARQNSYLTPAEKMVKQRVKKKLSNDSYLSGVTIVPTIREEKIRIDKKRKEDAITVKEEFFSNPLMENLRKTYPDRNYEFEFDLMAEWWLKNKRKLPKSISAFSNWLKNTKPDEGLQAERRRQLERDEKTKQLAELENTQRADPEKVKAMREKMKGIGKNL